MHSLSKPKVSVCIPVFNGGEYIEETIHSILLQTFEDYQLIVCDNCSEDDTEEIVRSFDDSRIVYVRNDKNLGLVGNANRCLDLAGSEFINIFHHDDLMLPENLQKKVRVLDEHPNVGFVHSNLILFDQKGRDVANNIWSRDSRKDYIESGKVVFNRYLDYLPNGASLFIG